MTCPNCGAVAGARDERCANCDVPLTVACPACGDHVQPGDEEQCPTCGSSLVHAVEVA